MKEGWLERLTAAIESDARSLAQLSADAGLGRNYVQQMLKDGKTPGSDKLYKMLDALGPENALYVATVLRVDAWELAFLEAASAMDAEAKTDLLRLARTLASQRHSPAIADDH